MSKSMGFFSSLTRRPWRRSSYRPRSNSMSVETGFPRGMDCSWGYYPLNPLRTTTCNDIQKIDKQYALFMEWLRRTGHPHGVSSRIESLLGHRKESHHVAKKKSHGSYRGSSR